MRLSRLVGAAVVVAGCGGGGGDGGPGPTATVASVTVVPSATTTSICGNVTLAATPRDAQGNALTRAVSWNQPAAFLSLSATTGASVTGTGIGVGTANVTASSDGQTSAPVAIAVAASGAAPATAAVAATAGSAFSPACVELAVGGSVTWTFAALHNVTFQGAGPTGGNINDQSSGTASRTFPAAGNYEYRCTLHAGMNGRVVVR